MNIGIDGRPFQGNLTGIGHYISALCQELDRGLPQATFYVYSQTDITLPITSARWISRVDKGFGSRYLKPVLWLKVRCGFLCKKDNLDYFLATAHFIPFLAKQVKVIFIVYDLNYRLVPESMSLYNLWAHRIYFLKDLKKSHTVISISSGTAQRLFNQYRIPSDAIIHPSVKDIFYVRSNEEVTRCLLKYSIRKPYLLSVTTGSPRKNVPALIKSFVDLKNNGHLDTYSLVFVGDTRSIQDHDLLFKQYGIYNIGYVPIDDLPALYSGCAGFVFPSLYEGFGMPVMEANKCHAPVVTTDSPELREAGGETAIYVRPTVEGIQEGILKLMNRKDVTPPTNTDVITYNEESKRIVAFFS